MSIIKKIIISNLSKISKKKKISEKTKILEDLGLDSLDYVKLLLAVEKALKTKVLEEGVDWSKVVTVSQLAKLFKKNKKN
jgi:acyl carrier protein|tara:strand:- start:131 stop:370 length:240 start_codon:yes stop_codon:yes gene_type:complete